MKHLPYCMTRTLALTILILGMAGCTVYPTYPTGPYASTTAPAVIYEAPAPAVIYSAPAPVYAYPRPYYSPYYGPTFNFRFYGRPYHHR